MLRDAKVQDYMTGAVLFVSPTTPIRVAQQLMEDSHIRHLPVVQENKLVGMLSSGDIRRAGPSTTSTLSIWEIAQLWEQVTVEQVMSHHVVHVRPETSMTHAAELLINHHVNCLPVVDAENCPIGILTDVDMFRILVDAGKEVQLPSQIATEPLPATIS